MPTPSRIELYHTRSACEVEFFYEQSNAQERVCEKCRIVRAARLGA
jgi:hypothetical protein